MNQHFKHLKTFFNVIKRNGLIISTQNLKLCHTKIWFLGHDILNITIKPIQQSIKFADKLTDEFKDKNEFQKCLVISIVLHIFLKIYIPKFQKIHPAWSHKHTQLVIHFKSKVNSFQYLGTPNLYALIIDESDNSLSRILK